MLANNQNYPQKQGLDIILKNAFSYWSKTLIYQLLFSLVVFSFMILTYYFVAERYGILEKILAAVQKNEGNFMGLNEDMAALQATPEYYNLTLALIFAGAFMYPLNMGFFQIYRKIDLGEKYGIEDLFVGYNGFNFFKFASYFLFWFFVYLFGLKTIILSVVWVFITLFVAPLMFFMDKRIFEGIDLTIKSLRLYFLEITVCVLVAVAFKYIGALTVFGLLFTYPFWNAVLYALYQKIFDEKG